MKRLLCHVAIILSAFGLSWLAFNFIAACFGYQPDWTPVLAF